MCNLTKINATRDQLYSAILPFLRDNLLSAGISTTYRDFKNLYYYYQQAVIARKIGEKKKPTHWYFKFEEHQMDYIFPIPYRLPICTGIRFCTVFREFRKSLKWSWIIPITD